MILIKPRSTKDGGQSGESGTRTGGGQEQDVPKKKGKQSVLAVRDVEYAKIPSRPDSSESCSSVVGSKEHQANL